MPLFSAGFTITMVTTISYVEKLTNTKRMSKQDGKTEYQEQLEVEEAFHFAGFKNLNSTPIPDEFFDVLAVKLSEAELRVLLYIMRRTFGFKKKADAISLSQLTGGIRKRDGSVLDFGTGLSKPSVLKAVNALQSKGIITIAKRTGQDGRNEINVYQLRFLEESNSSTHDRNSSHPAGYSNTEYLSKEYTLPLAPDPRFVSARAIEEVLVSDCDETSQSSTFSKREQKQSGANANSTVNALNHHANFKTAKELPEQGVNEINRQGKRNLPLGQPDPKASKATLPPEVKQINYQGKNRKPGGVKLMNQQQGSLQESSWQRTAEQPLLLATGALALQSSAELEPLEVEIDGDLLHINFRKLMLALTELGLSERLAQEVAYAYPEEYLWEKIELTRQQVSRSSHQRTLHNVAGYLRRAIEEDYQPLRAAQPRHSGQSTFAQRFPAALALQQASGAFEEEHDHHEDTAPLPPIHRPAGTFAVREKATLVGEASRLYNSDYELPYRASYGAGEAATSPTTHPHKYYNYSNNAKASTDEDNYCDEEAFSIRQEREYKHAANQSKTRVKHYDNDTQERLQFYATLWEQVQEDLAGRYRLGAALDLLDGSQLSLQEQPNGEREAVVRLRTPWQERELGMVARSAISLALRQRLGPGYEVIYRVLS